MKQKIGKSHEKNASLVCVVDDDESMREALESLLKSVGFRAAIFASAKEFLNAIENDVPDCLILDVLMPEMNGLELQKKLNEESIRIPIVFISAHGEAGEKEQAISAGAIDFLYKPFSEDSLLGAVGAAIKSEAN
jgi:FixJ family two-component response regulator